MPDREKVIEELDKLADEVNPWKESPPLRCDIPYPLLCDALFLLKKQETHWISVNDRMPDKSGTYLCYQPTVAEICSLNTVRWSTAKNDWMGKEVGSRITGISHWMPLPERPKEENDA